MKLVLPLIFLIWTGPGFSKPYKLDFIPSCKIDSKNKSFFYIHTILRLDDQKSEVFYHLECFKKAKECVGMQISLDDQKIGVDQASPLQFHFESVHVTTNTVTANYNDRSLQVDLKSNQVKLIENYIKNKKSFEFIWQGKCFQEKKKDKNKKLEGRN